MGAHLMKSPPLDQSRAAAAMERMARLVVTGPYTNRLLSCPWLSRGAFAHQLVIQGDDFMPKRSAKDPQHNPENQDPLTHAPGSHPVGVGAGAAGAGAAGAAIGGAVGGPIGAVVGAAVGAVAGGLGGKAAAESVNPSIEDAWWRDNYSQRPYAKPGISYEVFQPAYEFGWQARMMHPGAEWEQIEPDLGMSWELDRQ